MRNDPPTVTGSRGGLTPVEDALRVSTLTLAFGPDPARWGERAVPGSGPFPLNRSAPVFPGGPLADPEISRVHLCRHRGSLYPERPAIATQTP